MVQHRELFEAWCEDPKNGVIIADFAVAGTLAREVLDEPKEVMSHSGHKVNELLFCCSVHVCVCNKPAHPHVCNIRLQFMSVCLEISADYEQVLAHQPPRM